MTTVITVSEEILRIIEGEFSEMPGMRLTEAQFQRLWTLTPTEYLDVTAALIDRGVIARDAGGRLPPHRSAGIGIAGPIRRLVRRLCRGDVLLRHG